MQSFQRNKGQERRNVGQLTIMILVHTTRYTVFNEVSDYKGDISTSCPLQFVRSRVRNLTSDDTNLTSSSSLHEDMFSSYR